MLSKASAHRKDTRNAPATFTHQHFRTVAEIIRGLEPADGPRMIYLDELAGRFAESLAATNPNFDRTRFLMACDGLPIYGELAQ